LVKESMTEKEFKAKMQEINIEEKERLRMEKLANDAFLASIGKGKEGDE